MIAQCSSSHSSPQCTRMCHLVVSAVLDLSPFSSSLRYLCCSYCPTTSISTMWWTNTLRTSAVDIGTLAENEPRTFLEGDGAGAFIVPALKISSQVLSINDRKTVWENQCSNVHLLETISCLLLLVVICAFLVSLMKSCSRSSLKSARPVCDGRPFASPLFRRLAVEGPLSAVSFSDGPCNLYISLRYHFHLLQDVADQVRYMLTNGAIPWSGRWIYL